MIGVAVGVTIAIATAIAITITVHVAVTVAVTIAVAIAGAVVAGVYRRVHVPGPESLNFKQHCRRPERTFPGTSRRMNELVNRKKKERNTIFKYHKCTHLNTNRIKMTVWDRIVKHSIE